MTPTVDRVCPWCNGAGAHAAGPDDADTCGGCEGTGRYGVFLAVLDRDAYLDSLLNASEPDRLEPE